MNQYDQVPGRSRAPSDANGYGTFQLLLSSPVYLGLFQQKKDSHKFHDTHSTHSYWRVVKPVKTRRRTAALCHPSIFSRIWAATVQKRSRPKVALLR